MEIVHCGPKFLPICGRIGAQGANFSFYPVAVCGALLYNSHMITRSLTNYLTLGLAVLGSLDAVLLTYEHYHPDLLPCGGPGGCAGALQSNYGHVGPIPTALFGLGMYIVLIALCIVRKNRLAALREAETARAAAYASSGGAVASETPGELPAREMPGDTLASGSLSAPLPYAQVRQVDMAVWLLALAGVGISWWLQYTSFFQLYSFCPYCFTSAICITLIFLLASRDFLSFGVKLTGEQKMLAGVCAFILLWMGIMSVPTVLTQWVRIHQGAPPPRTTSLVNNRDFDRNVIVRSGLHVKGDPKAPYLVIEFGDYMCPMCKRAATFLDKQLQDPAMKSKIRLGFRNFPLPMHKWGHLASQAAEAAALQGKFWPMHDYLFEHQDEMEAPTFNAARFNDFAREVGLDVDKFKQDMDSDKVMQIVEQDSTDGRENGISSTPTFFIVPPAKKIWQVVGIDDMKKILGDKNHPVWK